MYLAVGSGIFYDVGRSYRWLGTDGGKHTSLLSYRANHSVSAHSRLPQFLEVTYDTFKTLRKEGYDSVQFPHTNEHNMWKFEIVDLRPLDDTHQRDAGTKACPTAEAAAHFFSGWAGTLPCACQEDSRACLNCGGPDAGARPSDGVVQHPRLGSVREQCT